MADTGILIVRHGAHWWEFEGKRVFAACDDNFTFMDTKTNEAWDFLDRIGEDVCRITKRSNR